MVCGVKLAIIGPNRLILETNLIVLEVAVDS